jgi:hypothetical protein
VNIAAWLVGKKIQTKVCVIGIPHLMIAFCLIVATFHYSDAEKYERKVGVVLNQEGGRYVHTRIMNMHLVRAFCAARNMWMAVAGVILWAVVARFKSLHETNQLHRPEGGVRPKSTAQRVMWLSLAFLSLVVADIPFCRVNYQMTLNSNITPAKDRLLANHGTFCANEMFRSATGVCIEFCKEAKDLSIQRYEATMWARDWHILGRVAAELFDGGRGVEQGMVRIDELFETRSCARVLKSVDKSNSLVNGICYFACIFSVVFFVSSTTIAFGDVPKEAATEGAPAEAVPAEMSHRTESKPHEE